MSRAKGNLAEESACEFLFENGFTIVEQNFYSSFGEIDIIALKNGILHFVEVKSALEYELAVRNITKTKLMRMIRTGDVYLKKNAISAPYQHDAIIVTPQEIIHLENITI